MEAPPWKNKESKKKKDISSISESCGAEAARGSTDSSIHPSKPPLRSILIYSSTRCWSQKLKDKWKST